MKVETMGRVLIAIGALVMLYAQLAMPISLPGAGIVNIHLISERQNILMLGGLFFIAGIVLFAAFKMKQTKEDELVAGQKADELSEAVKVQAVEIGKKGANGLSWVSNYLKSKGGTWQSNIARLSFGIMVGVFVHDLTRPLIYSILSNHFDGLISDSSELPYELPALIAETALFAVLIYSFRSKPTLMVLRNVLLSYVCLAGISKLYGYLILGYFRQWLEQDVASIIATVLLAVIFYKQYAQKK